MHTRDTRDGGKMYAVLLLLLVTIKTTPATNKCNTNTHFHGSNTNVRPHKCHQSAQMTCDKYRHTTIRAAYYEMQPFTSVSRSDVHHRIVQEVVEVALSECCGTCADVTYVLHDSYNHLMKRKSFNESDLRFPIFSQG